TTSHWSAPRIRARSHNFRFPIERPSSPLPAEAKNFPSGLKATQPPRLLPCPFRVAYSCPVVASHSRTVCSSSTEASLLPSGLKARDLTLPSCPCKGAHSFPVVTSQSFASPSLACARAEASFLPSG